MRTRFVRASRASIINHPSRPRRMSGCAQRSEPRVFVCLSCVWVYCLWLKGGENTRSHFSASHDKLVNSVCVEGWRFLGTWPQNPLVHTAASSRDEWRSGAGVAQWATACEITIAHATKRRSINNRAKEVKIIIIIIA